MSAQSGVFVLQGSDSLVALPPAQFSAELDFQDLLARFPELLVGDQIDSENRRRFLLVKQEQAVGHEGGGARWSVDHLFVDQDGVPTLVEVKRKDDTRLRREVVGQMLDYAANCQGYWTTETMRTSFEERCKAEGKSPDEVLANFLEGEVIADTFWTDVKTNLQADKVRMLFVADEVPSELRVIVEFLNKQMDPAEILAIELRQFAGQGLRTIVPRVFGQTEDAVTRKSSAPGPRWTEERFIEKIAEKFPEPQQAVAQGILKWMKGTGLGLVWGTGRENGSVYPLLKPQGVPTNPVYLSTEGRLWFQFGVMKNRPIFRDIETRRQLLERFAQVTGSGLTEQDLDRSVGMSVATISADPSGLKKVIAAFDWLLEQVKAADNGSRPEG